LRVQATNSPFSFEVTTDGTGVVGHAGAALLRELADRVGLTRALGWGQEGARRRHPDTAVLRDLAVMLAAGGDCLSDLAALRDQPELFGRVASTPTAWRVIERTARDACGLARLWAARAHARARAWRVGAHPEPELLIVDADVTLVLAHSDHSRARRAPTSIRWVRPATGLPGPRGCPGRAAGGPAAAGQRPGRRQR
jgi:Transposase DDE domain group 1